MINNPKIGQKVWFLEPWGQCIHSAKITALGETEVSVRNPEKYPYADIEWDDGGNSGCLLKNLYASREELQKELKKEKEKKIAEIKAKIKDASVSARRWLALPNWLVSVPRRRTFTTASCAIAASTSATPRTSRRRLVPSSSPRVILPAEALPKAAT